MRLPRPVKIRRLGHTGFFVSSYRKTLDFYTRLLGFRISDDYDLRTIPDFPKDAKDLSAAFLTHGSDHHAVMMVPGNALCVPSRGQRAS